MKETPDQLCSPRPSMRLQPAPLLALKIIYVCKLLLIHVSYSFGLPTGLGTRIIQLASWESKGDR